MNDRSRVKNKKTSVAKALSILFVILYVLGTSHLEWIHSFSHDHVVDVSHSDEEELDRCHRSIYHGDVQRGCHHESHVVSSDDCQMCDLVCHGDQTYSSLSEIPVGHVVNDAFAFLKQSIDSYWAVISSSRAPPVCA